jgi:hypothetical protein
MGEPGKEEIDKEQNEAPEEVAKRGRVALSNNRDQPDKSKRGG